MLSVDLFAGGGGASEGIRLALGVAPAVAINHDPAAIEMHAANHPGTLHLCESVFDVAPFLPRGQRPDLLWASPDCTHHSRARGGKPREKGIRALADVVIPWARDTRPRVICVENVVEFEDWGPLDADNQPIASRKGEDFRRWTGELRSLGYRVEWRALVAADYGAPTTRKRLFIVARCDGQPIRWPAATHGPRGTEPYRTAAECIDWSLPIPSIFDRDRPLAEATQRRIAEGVRRYVIEAKRPFLLNLSHGGRLEPIDEPLRTITATPKGGDRALVAAFIAKHYGGVIGHGVDRPIGTITAQDHHSLVGAELGPASDTRARRVGAWLCKYYGTGVGQSLHDPLGTVTAVDRFGLVTVDLDGEPWAVVDIGMRMLQPRELATAQGFGPEYVLTGTKREQVARIGNSVSPVCARALVAAQFRPGPVWVDDQPSLFGAAA